MARINITDGYFAQLTKDQLKDFMLFVMFANMSGVQYDSPLFKSLLLKLELPPLEATIVEDPPQEGQAQEPENQTTEVKKEEPNGPEEKPAE